MTRIKVFVEDSKYQSELSHELTIYVDKKGSSSPELQDEIVKAILKFVAEHDMPRPELKKVGVTLKCTLEKDIGCANFE